MNQISIITVSGHSGTGKSTVAGMLAEKLPNAHGILFLVILNRNYFRFAQ